MLKEITFINIPEDSAVVVFGLTKDQWTVDGNPEHTYFNERIKSKKKFVVDVSTPKMDKVLIRIRSTKYRWRCDKEYKIPHTGKYIPDLVLLTKDYKEYTFDGNEFLEIDNIMISRPKKEPIIKIKDKNDYNSPVEVNILPLNENKKSSNSLKKDFTKSIVAVIKDLNRLKFEEFRHSLPRPIMGLLYLPIPIGNNHYRIAFFHYDFLKLDNISKEEKDRRPWFYKKENADLLLEAKKNFVSQISHFSEKVKIIQYLSTRELKNYGYIHEDLPLTLPDTMLGVKTKLWKYLTLPKFVDLISKSQLWFAKPSTFNDPFESKTNKKTRAELIWKTMNRIIDDYNIAVYENDVGFLKEQEWTVSGMEKNEGGRIKATEYENFSKVPNNLLASSEYNLNKFLDSQLINSWHINDHESESMWNLYSNMDFGIAIISDSDSLRNSFKTSYGSPKILKIDYHDLHKNDKYYDYLPSAYKHIAFKHEEELRTYIGVTLPDQTKGYRIDVDPKILIHKIVVSPNSQSWFKENISWIIEKAGYNFTIEDSIFKNKLY